MNKGVLIIWNIALTVVVGLLLWNSSYEDRSSYDTAQNTVICGYITDLQFQTGADRTALPDCEGDVEKVFRSIIN